MSDYGPYFSPDKYSNPILTKRQSTLYNYQKKQVFGMPQTFSQLQQQQSVSQQYPRTANHARHPVLITCDNCQKVTLTETQQLFGISSTVWCILLMPIFCMGMCCLCSDTCKDIKHICSQCRKEVGVCKSQFV